MTLLHPMLVHFPIVFFTFEPFLLILGRVRQSPAFRDFAKLSFRLGYLFLIFSFFSGYRDSGGWGRMSAEVLGHFTAASVLLVSSTLKTLGEIYYSSVLALPFTILIWSLINAVLTITTAFWGGWIVYH